jgi:hypothetical protein
MTARLICWSLVAGFAVALGHLAWRTEVGPPVALPYHVTNAARGPGSGVVLAAGLDRDRESRVLYLRHLLFVAQRPTHAWIQLVGRDDIRLHINGELIDQEQLPGFPIGIVADITRNLKVGQNVIAVTAKQASVHKPPVVAVDGAYTVSGVEYPINQEGVWRYNTVPEQQGQWWFEGRFLDKSWPEAKLLQADLRGWVRRMPPRAAKTPDLGRWITPAAVDGRGQAVVRGEIDVPSRPRRAWLRVTATSNHRITVNGVPVDQREDQLDTSHVGPVVKRIYDITPVVRAGRNAVALLLTSPLVSPHLLADLEIEDAAGEFHTLGTDEHWRSAAGSPADGLDAAVADAASWKPCRVDTGYLDIMPWTPHREPVAFTLPAREAATDTAREAGLMAAIALVTLLACFVAGRLLTAFAPAGDRPRIPRRVVYLALLLPALVLGAFCLATFDPRVSAEAVYQPVWLYVAVFAVLAQWAVLAVIAWWRWRPVPVPTGQAAAAGFLLRTAVVAALMVAGFCIRFSRINTEPVQWDEGAINIIVKGVFTRCFPSYQLEHLPRMYLNSTEMIYMGPTLMKLVTNNDRFIPRLPACVFATLSILLIYVMGRRMFTPWVGVIAASLYALSPMVAAMSNFARYFAQLHFFAMLTLYFYWFIIRGRGPVNHKALWLTTVTFCITFLTWEGSALIAPGMIVALLVLRRGRLRTILCDLQVWAALVVAALVILLQFSHRILQVSQFMYYGTSLTDVSLLPMWQLYPMFNLWFYVWATAWNQDALLPILTLVASGFLAFRHPFQRPVRYLLLTYLVTTFTTALLLSVTLWRYANHMSPVFILLASAVVVSAVRALVRMVRQRGVSLAWPRYAGTVGVSAAVVFVALTSGLLCHLVLLDQFRVEGYTIDVFRFPNVEAPTKYVRDHMKDGDLVLAADPHQVEHFMRDNFGLPDFHATGWPCTDLRLPMTLNDASPVLRDRREGADAYPDLDSLKELFARNERIWYIVVPARHAALNVREAGIFLRQNMDVVYEDYQCYVMFRDKHRSAQMRHDEELNLERAKADYLP